MAKIIVALFAFWPLCLAVAQGGWQLIGKPLNATGTYSIHFYDENNGMVAGPGGSLSKTTDGGDTWIPLSSGTTHDLSKVRMINARTATAVGVNGPFLYTKDSGATWQPVALDPQCYWWDICFVNADTGFIGGAQLIPVAKNYSRYQCAIAKTTDGGKTWSTQFLDMDSRILSIKFSDAQNGYAVGWNTYASLNNIILKTTDGGTSWTRMEAPECNCVFVSCSHPDPNTLFVSCGFKGDCRVLKTIDAGANWDSTPLWINNAYFLDNHHGVAVSIANQILLTNDGGLAWRNSLISAGGAYDLFMMSPEKIFAVGQEGLIYKTQDGGKAWKENMPGFHYYVDINSLFFYNTQIGMMLGKSPGAGALNYIIKTTNGGGNWYAMDMTSINYNSGAFIDENQVYIASDKGVLKSTNGGESWSTTDLEKYNCKNLCFIHPDTGFVVGVNRLSGGKGEDVAVYQTSDSGSSWQKVSTLHVYQVSGFQMIDSKTGYLADFNSILKTSDGGQTWTIIYSSKKRLNSISCYGKNHCLVVGDSGTVVLFTNDGSKSQTMNLSDCRLNDACWIDTSCVYAAGVMADVMGKPIIYFSSDGGVNWALQMGSSDTNLERSSGLNTIRFISEKTGFAAGAHGVMFRTDDGGIKTWLNGSEKSSSEKPEQCNLVQNYPNPFNGSTSIKFTLPRTEFVTLKVYSLLGKEISTLLEKKVTAGDHSVPWNAADLPSGVYYFILEAGDQRLFNKAILLK